MTCEIERGALRGEDALHPSGPGHHRVARGDTRAVRRATGDPRPPGGRVDEREPGPRETRHDTVLTRVDVGDGKPHVRHRATRDVARPVREVLLERDDDVCVNGFWVKTGPVELVHERTWQLGEG